REQFFQWKLQVEQNLELSDRLLTELANRVKINYFKTINKYPFLENIIRLSYPAILQEIPHDDLWN
ncbi:MAG: hypothetical protein WAM14_22245, partial [Candidatus Nitrosopolaris sp.]